MGTRVHIVVDEKEKQAFRARAAAEGRSLSEWLREAARERLDRSTPGKLSDPDQLKSFFDACDRREPSPEPDWNEHLSVIQASRRQGLGLPPE